MHHTRRRSQRNRLRRRQQRQPCALNLGSSGSDSQRYANSTGALIASTLIPPTPRSAAVLLLATTLYVRVPPRSAAVALPFRATGMADLRVLTAHGLALAADRARDDRALRTDETPLGGNLLTEA